MPYYPNGKPLRPKSLRQNESMEQETEPPLVDVNWSIKEPQPLLLKERTDPNEYYENVEPQEEPHESLKYHIKGVAKHLRKWLEKIPLFFRILIILLLTYVSYSIMNSVLQSISPQLNCAYTLLGIIASTIIIYEFIKKEKKK